MLGSMMIKRFSLESSFDTWGTLRSKNYLRYFNEKLQKKIITDIDVLNYESLLAIFERVKPDLVINCVGVIKQLDNAKDPLSVLPLNSLFPHRLVRLCSLVSARLIHVSTDCVFTGSKGNYVETDPSDAQDLYGQSKFIGELKDYSNAVTLRTSIIGHELNSHNSLIDWFLSQNGKIKGYSNAIFSGLPTVELASVVINYVVPNASLSGLYHVASEPVSKYDLLCKVSSTYQHLVDIEADATFKINRSLNAQKFNELTGYEPPSWTELVSRMHSSKKL